MKARDGVYYYFEIFYNWLYGINGVVLTDKLPNRTAEVESIAQVGPSLFFDYTLYEGDNSSCKL